MPLPIQLKFQRPIWPWLALALLSLSATAEEPAPPALYQRHPLFADTFNQDSRADYATTGTVGWEPGKLELTPKSSVTRQIKTGSWIELKAAFAPSDPTPENPTADFHLTLQFDMATELQITLHSTWTKAGITRELIVYDTPPAGSTLLAQPQELRRWDISGKNTIHWALTYRYGLLSVRFPDEQDNLTYTAYAPKWMANVSGVRIRANGSNLQIRHLSARGTAPPMLLAADDLNTLIDPGKLNAEMMKLTVELKYDEAMSLALKLHHINERVFGNDHLSTASSLHTMANLHFRKNNFTVAESQLAKAIATYEHAIGASHPGLLFILNDLSNIYNITSRFQQSEVLQKRRIAICETAFGSESLPAAFSTLDLAYVHIATARLSDAEAALNRALNIIQLIHGRDHPQTAVVLQGLCRVYLLLGDNEKAEALAKRALQTMETNFGPENEFTIAAKTTLAEAYASTFNDADCKLLAEQVLASQTKLLGKDNLETVPTRILLASILLKSGDSDSALALCEDALELQERVLGSTNPATAMTYFAIAAIHGSSCDWVKSIPLFEKAFNIFEERLGPLHHQTLAGLMALSLSYLSLGDHDAADQLCSKAIARIEDNNGEHHQNMLICLAIQGRVREMKGDYGAAESSYLRALELRITPDHPMYVPIHEGMCYLYKRMRDYQRAETSARRAIQMYQSTLGGEHPRITVPQTELSSLYLILGNTEAAETLSAQVFSIEERALGVDHIRTTTIENRAMVLRAQGKVEESLALCRRAVGTQLGRLNKTAAILTEQQQLMMTSAAIDSLSLWLTLSGDNPTVADAWEPVLAWKGITTSRQQLLLRSLRDDPDFVEYARAGRKLSSLTLNPPRPPNDPKALLAWKQNEASTRRHWEEELSRATEKFESLEKILSQKANVFQAEQRRRKMTANDIAMSLAAQSKSTALVDLIVYEHSEKQIEPREDRVAAFVVLPSGVIHRVELGSFDAISKALVTWREALVMRQPATTSGMAARKLVWEPLAAHLDGIEQVLISPDRDLAQVPWGALPGKRPGTFLLEERLISIIPIPQLLPELLQREPSPGPPKSVLLMGGIDYGHRENPAPATVKAPKTLIVGRSAIGRETADGLLQFGPLPGTTQELKALQEICRSDSVRVLTRTDATEQSFRDLATQSQWLHIATHGFFAPKELTKPSRLDAFEGLPAMNGVPKSAGPHPGLLSGMAFAGANIHPDPGQDDGILTALEVTGLDLSHVDGAVLSACETGLGTVAGGEGLLGLQRSFQMAGAKTVVASLWQVSDHGTQTLMTEYYTNLWEKKLSKLEALRQAQLTMLRGYDPRKQTLTRGLVRLDKPEADSEPSTGECPPYFWAAFLLSGDWR